MSARLSVLIPHYGDPVPTRSLVDQLRPQLATLDAEIIITDDASPQPLGEVRGARVVTREENGGFGAAVNSAAAVASGGSLAILNSDLVVPDDFLSTLVRRASAWQPAVVAPRVVTPGHVGATSFRFPTALAVMAQRLEILGRFREQPWASRLIGEDRPRSADVDHVVDWVSGAAMLVPAAEFHAVGGFDEGFYMYLEEVDLQRRLRSRGLPAVYLPDVTVEHIGFGSSDPSRRERWHLESLRHYAEKWGWPRRLRIALETASLVTLTTDAARRLAGRDVDPVNSWRRRHDLLTAVWSDHRRRAE